MEEGFAYGQYALSKQNQRLLKWFYTHPGVRMDTSSALFRLAEQLAVRQRSRGCFRLRVLARFVFSLVFGRDRCT